MLRSVLCMAAVSASIAVVVTVGAHDEECFYEDVEQNNKLMGSFEVLAGGLNDVDAVVYGPSNEVHYSAQRQKTGNFNLLAPAKGLYKLCFSNRMSTVTEKTVAFSMHKGDDLFQNIAKLEQITPLEHEITSLADAITKIEDEQKYMWSRERSSKELNERTSSRVTWFTFAETSIIIAAGLWQLWTLRSLFEKARH